MSFGLFLLKTFAVVAGAFAEVTVLAAHAGAHLSKWEHVGATTALALPFLYTDDDAPTSPLPREDRAARVVEGFHAFAALSYLTLAAGCFVLAARGARPRALHLLLGAMMVGSIVVLRLLVRAVRRLRRPPLPSPDPPFAGGYRTRPDAPLAPDPPPPHLPPPPRRSGRRGAVVMALFCLALAAGGALIGLHPRRPSDVFWGPLIALFFLLCGWVHAEQILDPAPMLARGAGARVIVGFTAAGALALTLALGTDLVPLHERILVAVGGALAVGLGVFTLGRMWKQRRPRRGRRPRSRHGTDAPRD